MWKPAVKFRRKIYVGEPRHKDALDKVFANMSPLAQRHVANRIADGKKQLLFGWVDEKERWHSEPEYQNARMTMYGFD